MHVTSTVPLHTRSAPTRTLAAWSHIRQAPRSPQGNNMGSRKHITKTSGLEAETLISRPDCSSVVAAVDFLCKRGKRWKCAKRAHQINTNSKSQRASRTAVTNSIPLVKFRDLRALSYLSFMAAVSGHEAQLQKGMKGLDMAGWLHGSRASWA